MSQIPQSRPILRPELRIWDTVSETYASVFIENLRFLPRAALAPALLTIALSFLLQSLGLYLDPTITYETREAGPGAAYAGLPGLLASLVNCFPLVMLTVPWIRLTLLGNESAPPPLQPQWSATHWRVLGYGAVASLGGIVAYLAGSLVVLIVAIILGLLGDTTALVIVRLAVSGLGLLVVCIFAAAVFLRLLLPIPALLVGQAPALKLLWQRSRGHNIALFVAFLLVTAPLMVVAFIPFVLSGGGLAELIGEAPYPTFLDPAGPYFAFLVLWNAALQMAMFAVYAAFIAIVYRALFEGQAP